MKNKILSVLVLVGVIFSLNFVPRVHGDVNSAVAYLKTKNPDSWITMALVAAGETPNVDFLKNFSGTKATDYEVPILALVADGKDPRTFPNENFITKLKSFYSSNQIGDPNLLNDDIFGILAFISAGEPTSDPIIQGAKTFLLDHQNLNGSWSFALGSNGDTNMTAMAIMALSEVGLTKTDEKISKALDYLKSAQNSDGGFPYDPQSSWSTSSDASSDAWVISALNKIGESPSNWTKDGKSPIDHLNTLATEAGYYEFQEGNGEDSFTPITTSYAVIALSGKSYPVGKISAPSYPEVSYRVAGSGEDLCSGKTNAPNALELVKIIADDCGFTYSIKETSFGPYLERIGSDEAAGLIGWLYAVNFVSPQVGAADYELQADENVLWYYGDFNWKLTRLTLNQFEIPSGGNVQAAVEYFDADVWHPLEGAIVHYGLDSASTNSSGQVLLSPTDGAYQILATKGGYLRTEIEKLIVGQKTQTSLNLNANVLNGEPGGGAPGGETVGFVVSTSDGDSNLSFGDITPGNPKSENLTLKNQGQKKLYLESSVSGDTAFVNYLDIDSRDWEDFNMELETGQNKNALVELDLPSNYNSPGAKSGQLIFWAIPLND